MEEWALGYGRLSEIMDPNVVATDIIDQVECYPVYQPLLVDLADIAQRQKGRLVKFAYDWRKNIVTEASAKLAQTIAQEVANGADSISLVAHSMGTLVARHLLEGGKYSGEAWFARIGRFVAVCGPHQGAPTSLTKAMGLEGSSSVSASDIKIFTASPDYPSAYQCLPLFGTHVIFDETTQKWKNIYNHAVAQSLGLSPTNVDIAKASWDALDLKKRPAKTSYVFISGTGQTTEEVVELFAGGQTSIYSDDNGDGTVPKWSADSPQVAHFTTPGDHLGILAVDAFRKLLYQVFGEIGVVSFRMAAHIPGVKLSLDKTVYASGATMSLLLIPEVATATISGKIRLERGTGRVLVSETSIDYRGPLIIQLRAEIAAPRDFGVYMLSFAGSHATADATTAAFAVSRSASAAPTTPAIKFRAGPAAAANPDENLP
jgi:hypothetical protein